MFTNARIKLTVLYVLIISIIVFGFSVFLYQSIDRNLMDGNDDDFIGPNSHQHFIKNTLDSLQYELILADMIIIITSAGLSYVLAGKTLKPIQLSVEAQRVFAANASHELRTPLAVMRNDIEVLERNKNSTKDDIALTLKSNLEEIERMSGIVENLLFLARSGNTRSPESLIVDIGVLISNMSRKMQSSLRKKDISIIEKISPSIFIRGNRALLERAVLNILQNSIEHTPRGGNIEIQISKKDSNAHIEVRDSGVGISGDDLPHIFTRFYKGSVSSGSGLGLSIVKEIVGQHHGHIFIISEKDVGTTVTINFPLSA